MNPLKDEFGPEPEDALPPARNVPPKTGDHVILVEKVKPEDCRVIDDYPGGDEPDEQQTGQKEQATPVLSTQR